jgi:ABC-2 type transport system permease protein
MRNFWLVAKHEFRLVVFRRRFVVLTLAIPLGLLALVVFAVLVERSGESDQPVGYVDEAGFLDAGRYAALPDADKRIRVLPFADRDAALAALEGGEIQAVFVFPADYRQTLRTDLYYLEEPPRDEVWGDIAHFVRLNLIAGLADDVQNRLLEGPDITVYDVVSHRQFGESTIVNIILPFVATFFFFFATMSAAGYMLGVVATEKENRTMEVMVTSVTPGQLIGGKTVGLLAAALTQLAVYVIAAVVGLLLAAPYVPELQQVTAPWDYVTLMLLFFFPSYVLVSSAMVAIGAAVTEVQQGQQVAGILSLFFMLPILLLPVLLENPGHPLIAFFTLFPMTSFLTISLRWGLGTVPLWQIGISWLLLTAAALFMVWAGTQVFRVGMLRYGQPLNWKSAVAAIRGN